MWVSNNICFAMAAVCMVVEASSSVTSATTLTAAWGQSTWRNITSVNPSVFEHDVDTAQPAATPATYEVPETLDSITESCALIPKSLPTITETIIVTITSVFPTSTPIASRFDHVSWQTDVDSNAQNLSNLDVAFKAVMSAFAGDTNRDVTIDSDDHSSTQHEVPPAASKAVMNMPSGTIIFLNTTSPNYVMFDRANASVLVWTVPSNVSKEEDSEFREIVDNINTWLPFIEILGLVPVVWEVGNLIHAQWRMRRNRRDEQERAQGRGDQQGQA